MSVLIVQVVSTGGKMHILGANKFSQIYIRCMGALTMIAGNLFPMTSFAVNPIATRTPSNDTTLSPGLYRVLYGVAGLDNSKLNDITLHNCTGSSSCAGTYDTFDSAIQDGCKACVFTTEKLGSGCSHEYTHSNIVGGGVSNFLPDSCYYTVSGICAPVVVSGQTITGNCYGSLVAPADVISAMGCVTGSIVVSGKIMADAGCVYEPISVTGLSFDVSCPTAYPKNPLPYNRIFVPRTDIFNIPDIAKDLTDENLGRFFAVQGRRWIKNSNGSLVKITEEYTNANPGICLYGGCKGIKLIDANANFELINEPNTSGLCTEYGTATWAGMPPNCTATITSKNCDGVSTDSKGVWTKTCSYSE